MRTQRHMERRIQAQVDWTPDDLRAQEYAERAHQARRQRNREESLRERLAELREHVARLEQELKEHGAIAAEAMG